MSEKITDLAAELKKAVDEVKASSEEIQGRMTKGDKLSESAKATADEALLAMNDIAERMNNVEQKQARQGDSSEEHVKTLGESLLADENFEHFIANTSGGSMKTHVKAAITSAPSSAGALVRPDFVGVLPPLQQRLTVRDLLMPGRTDSNSVEYTQETGFTNNADTVAEGAEKPESEIIFAPADAKVRTIAHHMSASKQILSDASGLRSMIDGRLQYGLKLKEEMKLLSGDGVGENILGIVPQATAFADPASMVAYTIIDQLRLAQLQAVLAELPASGSVLNPIDWTKIELSKDGEGRHIIGVPQGVAQRTLWGLPVIETQSMSVGKFLTGGFSMGAQIFDAWDMSVGISFEHKDNYTKNMATILCEERLALAVYRPEAFIYGDLAAKV